MAFTIAFSGKGGVGKSTIAALCVRYLTEILKNDSKKDIYYEKASSTPSPPGATRGRTSYFLSMLATFSSQKDNGL